MRRAKPGQRFANAAIAGLDATMLSLIDVARERSAYRSEEIGLERPERLQLLSVANNRERLNWLVGAIGRDYMALSDL